MLCVLRGDRLMTTCSQSIGWVFWRSALLAGAAALTFSGEASAGSGANFVTYNHHVAEKGEIEVETFSDFSNVGNGGEDYTAQLIELEIGVTDQLTSSFYLEGDKIEGEGYAFGGFRFENRYRVFKQDTLLNPVLYLEYLQLEPEHRYIKDVTGRAGGEEEEEEEGTEHELETKLIIGRDFSDRLDAAFNWISEVNLDTGDWEFGYAFGLNYVTYKAADGEHEGGHKRGWDIEEVKLGAELFGGLGDSVDGLTLDGGETAHYAGLNLKGEFENGIELGVGAAFGLTDESEDQILRLTLAYAFH